MMSKVGLIFLVYIAFILSNFLNAQDGFLEQFPTSSHHDSLLKASAEFDNKAEYFYEQSQVYYKENKLEEALQLGLAAFEYVDQSDEELYANINLHISDIYQTGAIFDLDKAVEFADYAYEVHNSVSDELLFDILYRRTVAYYGTYNFETAIETCNKCLELTNKMGDEYKEFVCIRIMSNLLSSSPTSKTNLDFVDKTLELSKKFDDSCTLSKRFLIHGIEYAGMGNMQVAKADLASSLRFYPGCGPSDEKAVYDKLIADLYKLFGQRKKSLEHMQMALDYGIEHNMVHHQMHAFMHFAQDALDLGNYDLALHYTDEIINIDPARITLFELDSYHAMKFEALKGQGNYKAALSAYEEWHQLKDSIQNINNEAAIADLEKKYEDQLKDEHIVAQKLVIDQQNNQAKLYIWTGLLMSVLITFLGIVYMRARRSKRVLEKASLLIQKQSKELKKTDELKTLFFSNVSHELRTPLTLILGPLQSLTKEENLSNKGKSMLKRALQNGKDLLRMISSILDISKLESGKLELNEREIDLFEFSKNLVSTFDSYAQDKKIDLIYQYKLDKRINIISDPDKLERILANLIINALKFTPEKGKIELDIAKSKNHIVFSVSDSGIGIPKDDIEHIFDRYYSVSNNKNKQGTGIGLSLCKGYAELMNGTIQVESIVGVGTKFIVKIPVSITSHNVGETKTLSNNISNNILKNDPLNILPRLLLVEDNDELRAYMRDILAQDFLVIQASNGEEAFEIVEQSYDKIEVIITDYLMPKMDGFELVKALKSDEKYASIPVIMITAKADFHDRATLMELGIKDYIVKPFSEEELFSRIHQHV